MALLGSSRGAQGPMSSPLWPRITLFCWVDLPPESPMLELCSEGCGPLSAMHTVASRGS